MRILYFSWFREKIGLAEEEVSPPEEIRTIGTLIAWLKMRGPGYAHALSDERIIRAAVNQEYARLDHPITSEDEIAFFPPVTGG